jgi:hypothetical protein
MTVEVEAFPLHRFLGPLELKAFVAKGAPQSTIAELRKALVFLAMSHGLNYHPATHGRMVFSGPGPYPTPGAELRRRMACWLMSRNAVELLSLSRTADGGNTPAFCVRIEEAGG